MGSIGTFFSKSLQGINSGIKQTYAAACNYTNAAMKSSAYIKTAGVIDRCYPRFLRFKPSLGTAVVTGATLIGVSLTVRGLKSAKSKDLQRIDGLVKNLNKLPTKTGLHRGLILNLGNYKNALNA
ncbi:MAG: hypothetical protein K1060chlam2_00556 [Chlamydiae bacterium]|nr:hypothetical protein [Chlamydiota bacterium]